MSHSTSLVVLVAAGLALPLAAHASAGSAPVATASAVGAAKPTLRAPKTKKQPRAKRKLLRRPTKPVQPPPEDPPPPPAEVAETGALAGLTAAHNAARTDVGVGPLVWSPQLAGYAQQWAQHLADNGCGLQHRQGDSYGENMFWTTTPRSASYVVSQWVDEKADYDHETHSCSGVCGHYTQVVWSSTTTLGCGMATCGQGQVWVCNYDPQGNYLGQAPY